MGETAVLLAQRAVPRNRVDTAATASLAVRQTGLGIYSLQAKYIVLPTCLAHMLPNVLAP